MTAKENHPESSEPKCAPTLAGSCRLKVNELTAIERALPTAIAFAEKLDGKVKFQIAILVPG